MRAEWFMGFNHLNGTGYGNTQENSFDFFFETQVLWFLRNLMGMGIIMGETPSVNGCKDIYQYNPSANYKCKSG